MTEEKRKKSDTIAKVLGILIGLALVLGISYALFRVTLNGTKKNRIVTGTLSLKIIDDDEEAPENYTKVELINATPESDAEGLKEVPYTFTIKNDGNVDASYDLKLEVDDQSNLSDEVVKFAFIKGVDENYSTPKLLSELTKEESRTLIGNKTVNLYTLDQGTLDVGNSIDYIVNLWIDEQADNTAMDKELNAIIRVDGVQKNR